LIILIRAKKSHELDDMQSKTLINDLYRAMCDCYNDHRSHRVRGQDTASSSHDLYNLNVKVLSIETLSDLRRLSSRGLFDCVSFKSLFCWERGFVNKHTIWAIEWSSIEVWLLNSALTTMKGIQVDWKVEMLRKRGNQDLTTCRLRVRDCAELNSIVSLSHTFLYLKTSMHFYGLEFSSGENRWFFVSVRLFYKDQLFWSTEEGNTNRRNLVYWEPVLRMIQFDDDCIICE